MAQPDYDNDLVFPPQPVFPTIRKNLTDDYEELKEKVEDLKKDLKSALWYQSVQNEEINNLKQLLKECKEFLRGYSKGYFVNGYRFIILDDDIECDAEDAHDLLTRINVVIDEEK